jgi:hypothetical protein
MVMAGSVIREYQNSALLSPAGAVIALADDRPFNRRGAKEA